MDDTGAPSRSKAKAKNTRPRRNLQKARYVFDFSMQSRDLYKDHFKPNDRETENRLFGISEMVTRLLQSLNELSDMTRIQLKPDTATQTQEETQLVIPGNPKRGSGNNEKAGRPLKKVKISVTTGVDLAE